MSKAQFQIEAVDAHALFHALERQRQQSHGNGVSSVELIEPDIDGSWFEALGDDDFMPGEIVRTLGLLQFTVERYAMAASGFHVGYEKFVGSLTLYPFVSGTREGAATPESQFYVIPSTLGIEEIVPAEEPPTYNAEDARAFFLEWESGPASDFLANQIEGWRDLDDEEQLDLAYNLGLGEGDYYPPDDDFAYQELEHHLNQALADLPQGKFAPADEGRMWTIEFDDGEVVWSHNLDQKGESND